MGLMALFLEENLEEPFGPQTAFMDAGFDSLDLLKVKASYKIPNRRDIITFGKLESTFKNVVADLEAKRACATTM